MRAGACCKQSPIVGVGWLDTARQCGGYAAVDLGLRHAGSPVPDIEDNCAAHAGATYHGQVACRLMINVGPSFEGCETGAGETARHEVLEFGENIGWDGEVVGAAWLEPFDSTVGDAARVLSPADVGANDLDAEPARVGFVSE
jgi:hypothetical protein